MLLGISLLSTVALVAFGFDSGNLSLECTYKSCDCEDKRCYSKNEATGNCTRNDHCRAVSPLPFLLGQTMCRLSGERILEETTCVYQLLYDYYHETIKAKEQWPFGSVNLQEVRILPKFTDLKPVWDDTQGCQLLASPKEWTGFPDGHPVKTELCLQVVSSKLIVFSLLSGLLTGALLAWMGYGCKCNIRKDKDDIDDKHRRKRLRAGAKAMAADIVVKGGGARRMCLLYRMLQVTANTCVPAVLLIWINPGIVFFLYVLLYAIPAIRESGFVVLRSHIYMVTPPDASLFGIDLIQPDFRRTYLYHAIRPYMMWSFSCILAFAASKLPNESGDTYAWNPIGFFRAAILYGCGPLILDFTWIGVSIATLSYSAATLWLYFRSLRDEWMPPISLAPHRQRGEYIAEVAEFIIDKCLEWERDYPVIKGKPDLEKRRRLEEAKEQFFKEDLPEKIRLDGRVKVQENASTSMDIKPFSKFDLYKEFFIGFVTLCSYAYKLVIFVKAGRIFMAFILAAILGQALTVIIINGTVYRAVRSVPRSARLGVQTTDFFSLAHWNDTGAGVLYLMVTVYGLPISGMWHWWQVPLAVGMNAKAVYSLAKVLVSIIDMDTFDVYKPQKGHRRHHCLWPFSILQHMCCEETCTNHADSKHYFLHANTAHPDHEDEEEDDEEEETEDGRG